MERLHLAEFLFPLELSLQVEAVEPVRAEEGEQKLTIGDRRVGCQARGVMPSLVGQRALHGALPEGFPVTAAQGQGHELVVARDRHAVVSAGGRAVSRRQGVAVGHGRGQENQIAPDDRGGMSAAGNRRHPADVLAAFLAPLDGRISVGRYTRSQRPAPLGPVVCGIGGLLRRSSRRYP